MLATVPAAIFRDPPCGSVGSEPATGERATDRVAQRARGSGKDPCPGGHGGTGGRRRRRALAIRATGRIPPGGSATTYMAIFACSTPQYSAHWPR